MVLLGVGVIVYSIFNEMERERHFEHLLLVCTPPPHTTHHHTGPRGVLQQE